MTIQCCGITKQNQRCRRMITETEQNTINDKTYCTVHLQAIEIIDKPEDEIEIDEDVQQIINNKVNRIPAYLLHFIPQDALYDLPDNISLEELEDIFLPEHYRTPKEAAPNIQITKDTDDIFECQCCFNECNGNNMVSCSDGHLSLS